MALTLRQRRLRSAEGIVGAGDFDCRIRFYRLPTTPRDGFGDQTTDPTFQFECSAARQIAGGAEFWGSNKRNSESTARFIIRYRQDLNPRTAMATHQIRMIEDRNLPESSQAERIYDIKAIEILGRRQFIQIEVSEVL